MSLEHGMMLMVWGTLVGLDLVSMPQAMIARPLVAGAVAGAMLGDLKIGLQLGVILELFQYDILPMGAVRYPEYGPATVAAVAAAHAAALALPLAETERQLGAVGLGVVVGLVTGLLGGISIHQMRRINTRAVRRCADALERGETNVIVRLHVWSILRDGARAALVTAVGLAFAAAVGDLLVGGLPVRSAMVVAVVVTGAALAAGTSGTLRLVPRGADLRWFAAGLLGGAAGAWLR